MNYNILFNILPLPDDIIKHHIIPFTYNIQPLELLLQIKLGAKWWLYERKYTLRIIQLGPYLHLYHRYENGLRIKRSVLRVMMGFGGLVVCN